MLAEPEPIPDDSRSVRPSETGRRSFASSLWTVATSTLVSRILGMFRDTVTARMFGVSPITDAFWLAFKIPNLARRLFGEGALTAAFLPAFSRQLVREGNGPPLAAWQLASAVFSLIAGFLLALVLLGEGVLWGLATWSGVEEHTRLLLGLTAVLLPYALLICLAAQVTAVLHALGHFTWPALVPVVLNLVWISSIWLVDPWFAPDQQAQAYALAVCVVVAGVFQLALQIPTLHRLGFRFQWQWRDAWPDVRGIVRAMLPVMFGLSIEQINTLLDGLIAWFFSQPEGGGLMPLPGSPPYPLQAGAVSALYFGERLYQFPVGVFGVALGTVLFPLFARHAAQGAIERLRDDLTIGLRLVLTIGIPASAGLMLVAEPLTRLLLEHGEFTHDDSRRTAALIVAYGSGVWAFCSLPILYRGFYALGDRISPVRVGMAAVVGDAILNLTLIWPLAERGLAWSTALSAVLQGSCLVWLIQRRIGRLDWARIRKTTVRALGATTVMVVTCLVTTSLIPTDRTTWRQVIALAGPVAVGLGTYVAAARLLGLVELSWLLSRSIAEPSDAPDDNSDENSLG
jgi:putative peptidoglycan lipid II flippase